MLFRSDPVNTEILSKIMIDLVKSGKYIIMSSHQMSVIEEFCSDLVILNRGKTVLSGNLKEIKDSYETNKVLIETTNEIDGILKRLKVDVLDKNDDEYLVSTDADNRRKLLKELVKNNIDVKTFKVIKPTLHEIFIEKVGE